MSALDKLNALNAAMETSEDKKPQERPSLPVPSAALEAFKRLVPALRILKIAEARKDIEEGIISDEMMTVYSETLFSLGSRPTNPRMVVKLPDGRPDMSGLFQVQERWKLQYEKGEAPANVRIAAALVRAGFSQLMADTIVKNEINCQPLTTLSKPLNELAVGTDLEKSAAEKIIGLAFGERVEPLTAQERAVALKKVDNVEVKDGILQRIKQYCASAQQLKMLFKVITPVHFVSHAKCGESMTEEERTQWLAAQGQQLILGTKVPEKEKK